MILAGYRRMTSTWPPNSVSFSTQPESWRKESRKFSKPMARLAVRTFHSHWQWEPFSRRWSKTWTELFNVTASRRCSSVPHSGTTLASVLPPKANTWRPSLVWRRRSSCSHSIGESTTISGWSIWNSNNTPVRFNTLRIPSRFALPPTQTCWHFWVKWRAKLSCSCYWFHCFVAICLEFLNDTLNSQQAHQTAVKSSDSPGAITLINYAVFLYNNNTDNANREQIIELMMEFEKCWLKRKNNSIEFDENIMKTATMLATQLNLSTHLSWLKASD